MQEAAAVGKIVSAICHDPQVLIDASLLKGKKATSSWNIHVDLANAGAIVIDEPAIADGNIITSPCPLPLPSFMNAITCAVKSH
ncbi:hypothetical protein WA1_11380 [Scytonema hofmannii PCC 7110]|uniref:DJ-1/PfpI domain-containing protein n=1 Tax=Scytonema hofmannii PCC 7110 TaxID=128403 RepID=A0A139XFH7_9CYAN|nr:hypothetical protein WA1_11380 [Scytonema hofmannii PCC 7110]